MPVWPLWRSHSRAPHANWRKAAPSQRNKMTQTESAYTSNIEPPLRVADAAEVEWDDEAEIVVAGFGGAGVVAAIHAMEAGANVIAVDRFSGGGATEKSGGVVYAGGTKYQHEAGYQDTAEEMYKYLSYEGTPVRPETLKRFCDTSAPNIAWLEKQGVQFASGVFEERIAYPPDGYFLYYSGMEKFRGDHAKVAPRGHRTFGKGATGKNYFKPLRDKALNMGLQLMTHAPVRRLIVDQHDHVVGVEVHQIPEDEWEKHQALFERVNPYKMLNGSEAEKAVADCREFERGVPQTRRKIRATGGVILSAGGYNYNLDLFGRYRPIVKETYPELVRGGSMGCDGSGIELGTTVGGGLSHMDRLFVTKAISPPHEFIFGVLVNMDGQRFITEDAYLGNVGCAISEQSQTGSAWLILDANTFWAGVKQAVWPLKNAVSWWGMPALLNIVLGGTKRASSLAGLARKVGIDPSALEKTVEEFNSHARSGTDPVHGKMQQHLRPLETSTCYAVNLSVKNKWGFSGTMPYGGLTVDEDTGAVTREDGTPIVGLYAAGRTAVGVCSESNFSGLSIADTVFSGRRAADAILRSNDAGDLGKDADILPLRQSSGASAG